MHNLDIVCKSYKGSIFFYRCPKMCSEQIFILFKSSWSICTHYSRFWEIMDFKSSDNFRSDVELGVPILVSCLSKGFQKNSS
jgi:hypothetical protein